MLGEDISEEFGASKLSKEVYRLMTKVVFGEVVALIRTELFYVLHDDVRTPIEDELTWKWHCLHFHALKRRKTR